MYTHAQHGHRKHRGPFKLAHSGRVHLGFPRLPRAVTQQALNVTSTMASDKKFTVCAIKYGKVCLGTTIFAILSVDLAYCDIGYMLLPCSIGFPQVCAVLYSSETAFMQQKKDQASLLQMLSGMWGML